MSDRAAVLVAAAATVAVAAAACTSPDDSRTGAAESSDTAWHLEEDLRLGSAASDTARRFGRIRAVTTDSKGRIYVLDRTTVEIRVAVEIRVFDPGGAYSHSIGREGSGPGELVLGGDMAMGPGDTLWVVDDGTGHYTRFTPDGTFIDAHARGRVGRCRSASGAVLTDGSFVTWDPSSSDDHLPARFLCIPIRLRVIEASLRADSLPPVEHTRRMFPGSQIWDSRYGGRVAADVSEDGSIWFAHTRDYTVYGRTLEGDTIVTFGRQVTPPPLAEADRDSIRELWSRRPGVAAEYIAGLETKPIIHRIAADDAGHVFVFIDVADEPPGSIVDVFSDAGDYLDRVRLPDPIELSPTAAPVVHVTSEYLYVVVKDELDVPYVSRLRIHTGGGPATADHARGTKRKAP